MKYYAPKYSEPPQQYFGITAALAAPLIAGLTDVGVGAGVAGAVGTGIAGGALGAAGTAAFDAISGQPITPLGVLSGALPGAAIGGLGPAIGSATGLGTTAGDVLAGAGAGAAGAGLTGSNPLLGAATGGAEGLAAGLSGAGAGAGATPTTSPVAAATGPSAASFGISAPATTAAPATSATPLAASAGGGAPATAQLASAGGGGGGGGVSNIPTGGGGGVGSNWPSFADTATVGGTQWPSPSATTPIPSAGGDDFLSKITGFAKSNPGLLLSAAPLALSMFGSPSQVPGQAQLQNSQLQAASMGKTLSAFQLSGTLPAGMQQVVDAKTAADKAAVRSHFAQLGYTGSTAEVQALEQIDQASTGQIALLGQQLASQGLDWTHISQQELETLLNAQLKQQSDFSSALSSLAKGLVPIGSAIDKAVA